MDKTSRSKDAVTQRILETTQETERLKQELQNLIAAGISGSKNSNISTTKANIPLESTNKVQIIRSYDPKHSQHIKKPGGGSAEAVDPAACKNEAQTLSPKKPKTYDVQQAREYIKKQRVQRKEEFKSKKTETKITAEMRKEKLQELQQKAADLVKKNVEAKRQRSKSRERKGMPPSNESVIVGFNCAEKTKRHLEEPVGKQIRSLKHAKDPNLLYPPEPAITLEIKVPETVKDTMPVQNLNVASTALKKHSKSLQNLAHLTKPHYGSQKESFNIKSGKSHENVIRRKSSNEQLMIAQSNITLRSVDDQSEPKYIHSRPISYVSTENSSRQQSLSKSKITDYSDDPLKSSGGGRLTVDDPAGSRYELLSQKPVNSHLLKKSTKKNRILVSSNITLKPAHPQTQVDTQKESIDTQKVKVATPEWLKDTMGQGDPYNFINTVKRRLKFVTNEKKPLCVDVGVQGNLENNVLELKTEEISKKSDLKSFISHKCLNLDPHTVQHIELDRKKSYYKFKDGPTLTNPSMGSDYDSDTSKNIPSISSESGTSLRKNAEYVKQSYALTDLKPLENAPPNLDTKKVDDIKLEKTLEPSKSEITTQRTSNTSSLKVPVQEDVERIKKILFKDSDHYSSDFIPTDLSKTRDSLISFNCAKVSPNRVPDHYISRSENIDSSPVTSHIKVSSENVPKQFSESQKSDRKSSSLNSASEDGSQKGNSRSAQFYSLYSELRPSTTDPELNHANLSIAYSEVSEFSSSEVATVEAEKNSWKSDGFTEVLKPKDLFTDSNSQNVLSNCISERSRTVSNRNGSARSSELYKSKSEQIVSNKKNAGVFSKSDSNIYETKENSKMMPLKEPKLSLNIGSKNGKGLDDSRLALMKNISIRSGDMNKTNEIHLKFEAEIHLLNDFNQSLRHFSEIEKAFESLRSKNDSEVMTKKVLQNRDTQTSIRTKTSTITTSKQSDQSMSQISTINYSRGSGMDSEIHTEREDDADLTRRSDINVTEQENNLELSKRSEAKSDVLLELTHGSDLDNVLNSINLEDTEVGLASERTDSMVQMSQVDDLTIESRNYNRDENMAVRNFAGMSLRMFDQLIKDEDARIENWKKIVKIREQALLDRTRGELVYLEMQKKQLIETGKMPEASLIKKKQRGILLKHQQEKHEMQRLKQMQKEASAKRKTLLKKEKNLIKNQLLSDNMLSKLKTSRHHERNERRLSGPLKVIQATGSVHSETSLSRGVGGTDQEIRNITSRTCSVVLSAASDNVIADVEPLELTLARSKNMSSGAVSSMKKSLLMREHALAKRRKTVEELLQWHKKLLDEEKAIEDLESKVEKIISKIPSESNEELSKDLPKSVTEKTSDAVNTPSMSEVLDRLLPSTERVSVKSNSPSSEASRNIPQQENLSEDSNRVVSSANYSTDFDVESVPEILPQNSDDQSNVSSISQLIENFSKIEGNILTLSLVQKRQSLGSEEGEVSSVKSDGARTTSSAAEDIVSEEQKSEVSSRSSHIASEVEVKRRHVENQDVAEDSDRSVIIIEEPSQHIVANSEENKLVISVEEIKGDESTKEESEEIAEVDKNSESIRTGQSESEDAPKTSVIVEELFSRDPINVCVSKELEDINVPDFSSKSSLREYVESEDLSVPSEDDDQRKVSEEFSSKTDKQESIVTEQTEEQHEERREEVTEKIETENEPETVDTAPLEDSVMILEETSHDENVVAEVSTVETSSIHEDSKPSTSLQKPSENSHFLSTKEEIIPTTSHKSADETQKISAQILSEEPTVSVSKGDVFTLQQHEEDYEATSQQPEEVEEYAASHIDVPSTSHQTEEHTTTSQVLSLPQDETEQEPYRHSISTQSIVENDPHSPSIVEEDRQSFENKTDEEKVASLSIRASVSQNGSVSEDRTRSSVTRPSSLDIEEPSFSGAKSLTTSKGLSRFSEGTEGAAVSEKSRLGETSGASTSREEGLPISFVKEKRSKDFDEKDAEKSVKYSKISQSTSEEEEKLPEISLISEQSLPTEEKSKILLNKEDEYETSGSSKINKVASEASLTQEKSSPVEEESTVSSGKAEKSGEIEENQSDASPVETVSASATNSSTIDENSDASITKSAVSPQESVSSEKPSKSSASEKLNISPQTSNSTPEKSPRSSLDVRKRVQEILSEASPVARGDKSPRMQDLCAMTYDLISPTQSPESGSPLEERTKSFSLGSEAEELLRKQLAIEQEIKLLTEQQQKEQAPQFYIREIPNKPPPPYTPPSKAKAPKTPSIIPSSKEEIEQITEYSAKIIHKAYLSNNLDNISISDNTLNLIAKNIDKGCYKYVFDLCKEVAIDHYGQFTIEAGPSWLQLEKKIVLAPAKPLHVEGLKKLMNKKLLELFGFEKREKKKENAIMKWSRKKRDHVDEVLVQEMQAQESSWTNFDRDELLVKDRMTNEIMEMLLKETAQVLKKTVQKKSTSQ